MSADLRPQTSVSPDGQEIWDWAGRLSDAAQRAHERRQLFDSIRNTENRCGSCVKWMIPSCPKEVHSNVTGRRSGPHCDMVKCSQFVMSDLTASTIVMWRLRLDALKDTP